MKERLKAVRYSQKELLMALKERFNEITVDAALLSRVLSGIEPGPRGKRIMEEADIIISEWEGK